MDLIFHGARVDATGLVEALDHLFETNGLAEERGGRPTPICIWGTHGIGKTMIVEQMARERGWQFAYCAPAQFEEMGDLNGLPVLSETGGERRTAFAPPEWVPDQDGPGVLLLDDLNRADDRILRGLMQLLQNFELFAWKLPPRWQIVATANPEGGDYSVTPMDDALLTRMYHLTLDFDPKAWAAWASVNDVDPRGVAFVMIYPEVVTGRRTTPRSLTQFFRAIRDIEDLKARADLVQTLALATLDETTVASFMTFISDGLDELVGPDEILEATDFKKVSKRLSKLAHPHGKKKEHRVDHIATVCTRLFMALTRADYVPKDDHRENLVAFITDPSLPNDLRMALHRDLSSRGSDAVKEMLRDKAVVEMLLEEM